MTAIKKQLAVSPYAVLQGVMGIGKTQLAVSYLSTVSHETIIFLNASSQEDMRQSLYNFLKWDRRLPETGGKPLRQDLWDLFNGALQKRNHYLICFDGVNDGALLSNIFQLPRGGKYLITTRLHNLGPLGGAGIHVGEMNDHDAFRLLKRQNPGIDFVKDKKEIAELNRFCGGIPLALERVSIYMAEHGENLENCLSNLEPFSYLGDGTREPKSENFNEACLHPALAASFQADYLSIKGKAVESDSFEAAFNILEYCSVLSANYIDAGLLCRLTGYSRDRLNKGMKILLSVYLIDRSGDYVYMKEVFQYLIRREMHPERRKQLFYQISRFILKELSHMYLSSCRFQETAPLIMHAQKILTLGAEHILESGDICRLYGIVGEYEIKLGDFEAAEKHLLEAGALDSPEPLPPALVKVSAACLYEASGCYSKAFQALEAASACQEQMARKYPVRFLQFKQIEAYLYDDLMDIRPAERALDEAFKQLESCVQSLRREEAAELRMELINIRGHLCLQKGDYRNAAEQYRQVLSIGRLELQENAEKIPIYAWAVGNLAYAELLREEQYDAAIAQFQKQRVLMESFYHGAAHPDFAFQDYALGRCYLGKKEDGTYEKAAAYFNRALDTLHMLRLDRHPLAPQIHLAYEELCIEYERYEEALEHSFSGLSLLPELMDSDLKKSLAVFLHIGAGQAYFFTRRFSSAVVSFRKAKNAARKLNRRDALIPYLMIQMQLIYTYRAKARNFTNRIFRRLRGL